MVEPDVLVLGVVRVPVLRGVLLVLVVHAVLVVLVLVELFLAVPGVGFVVRVLVLVLVVHGVLVRTRAVAGVLVVPLEAVPGLARVNGTQRMGSTAVAGNISESSYW